MDAWMNEWMNDWFCCAGVGCLPFPGLWASEFLRPGLSDRHVPDGPRSWKDWRELPAAHMQRILQHISSGMQLFQPVGLCRREDGIWKWPGSLNSTRLAKLSCWSLIFLNGSQICLLLVVVTRVLLPSASLIVSAGPCGIPNWAHDISRLGPQARFDSTPQRKEEASPRYDAIHSPFSEQCQQKVKSVKMFPHHIPAVQTGFF